MIALWLSGPVFAAQSPYQPVQPDPQAVATASKWLSVVDAGNYAESFAMFPARIRSGGDAFEKHWVSFLRMKRAPLGHVLSRKLIKAWFTKTLPGFRTVITSSSTTTLPFSIKLRRLSPLF